MYLQNNNYTTINNKYYLIYQNNEHPIKFLPKKVSHGNKYFNVLLNEYHKFK